MRRLRDRRSGESPAALPALFLIVYLIWGFTYVATRIALRDIGPFTLAFTRSVLAALVLAAAALALRRPWPRSAAAHGLAFVVGLLNVSGLAGMLSFGLTRVPAGEASLLVYTQPLQVAVLSALVLRERLAPRQVAGLVLGFAGMVVVLAPRLQPGESHDWIGYGALLFGAFCWALSAVLFRWGGRAGSPVPPVDVVWLSALQSVYGALPLLAVGVAAEGLRATVNVELVWTTLFVGVLAGGVANLLWFYFLTRRAATVVAAYVFLVPAFAVVFGALVLAEPMTPTLLAGGFLTLTGIAAVARGASAPGTSRPPAAANNSL